MIWIILTLVVGLLLSALFSGSETGFYRASRVRLVLDGLAGDRTAERLLWMTNNPSTFIATTLVGNNVANYLVSLAIVLGSQRLFGENFVVELLGPLLLAPVLFIYGESLPKTFFLYAPNALLKRTHSLFLFFAVLFAPVTLILWAIGRAMRWILGAAPETVRMRLAREELKQVLSEGHEAGILKPVQHHLAQTLFSVASESIGNIATPMNKAVTVSESETRDEALRLAKKFQVSHLTVEANGEIIGYKSVADLRLQENDQIGDCRTLRRVTSEETVCAVLIKMQTDNESMLMVVDDRDVPRGIISERLLLEMLDANFGSRR